MKRIGMTRIALLLAGSLVLAGCSTQGGPMAFFSGNSDEGVYKPAAATPARARTVKIPDVDALPSKSPAFLLAHFGDPDVKRDESGAQFWTYSHTNCVLYIILYDEGGGDYSVHHIEVDRQIADQSGFEDQLKACLSEIATAHQRPDTVAGS